MKTLAKGLPDSNPSEEEIKEQIEMYESGFIRLTEAIEPRAVMRL
jgi:hypothetical protein